MVSGPVGSFCADSVCSAKVLVLIAAGTGVGFKLISIRVMVNCS